MTMVAQRRWVLVALVLLWSTPAGGTAEELWTHTPLAVYAGDMVQLSLRSEQRPQALPSRSVRDVTLRQQTADAWEIHFRAVEGGELILRLGDTAQRIQLVPPGSDPLLAYQPGAGLRHPSGVGILCVDRQEQSRDRRYGLLRPIATALPDTVTVLWPHAVDWGVSPLVSSLPHWRNAVSPRHGEHVVLVLDYREALVGWVEGEFAALLSWAISDAQRRGKGVSVLPPIAPERGYEAVRALERATAAAVADAGIQVLEPPDLTALKYWLESPGVLGSWLNEDGRRQLNAWAQRHLNAATRYPEQGWLEDIQTSPQQP